MLVQGKRQASRANVGSVTRKSCQVYPRVLYTVDFKASLAGVMRNHADEQKTEGKRISVAIKDKKEIAMSTFLGLVRRPGSKNPLSPDKRLSQVHGISSFLRVYSSPFRIGNSQVWSEVIGGE